jgi:NAD(P)-dependent dehydrogenase (short-subunit alcohol dehydrogenase family)/pimeloyl-ACP methyl ester carboxylesterase
MTSTRRVISSDGTELATYETGATSGPVLVAIHGYPDNHAVWDGVAAEVGEQYRVITYDVRGTGDSDQPTARSAYRMALLVDDLVAVLDAVEPHRPVHLLAHDWGSVQAWAALTDDRLDGRIASFTSISGPSLDQAGTWMRAAHRHPLATLRQLADSYYTVLFQLPKVPEAAARAGLLDRAIASAAARTRSSAATGVEPPRTVADKINGLNLYRANMLGHLGRPHPKHIHIPVQVIAPRDDPYVTPALAFGAPEPYVHNLRTRLISGGHWVVSQRPDVIAGCVREFVDYVVGAPESRELVRARTRASGPFHGQLVVVTGGARGIGRATALEFARNGADIVIADVNDVAAKETVHELIALGVTASSYHLDVADTGSWEQFATQVRADHGVPDVIVNNAGIGMGGPFLATSIDDWQKVLGVNLWGVIHGSRLFGAQLVERGQGGRIINVASAAAFAPSRTLPAYSTTKAAVLMLTECLRAELAREGIGVIAICPGFVDSDITKTTIFVGADETSQTAQREHAAAAYHRRNYPPERVARHIVRAAERNTPVAAISAESKLLRALGRLAPPLARQFAKVDLGNLGPRSKRRR